VRAIVVASDGLWDALLPEEVRAIVRNPEFMATQDAEAATAALMAVALKKGIELFGTDHDNVTAVVVYAAAAEPK
jgi:serine/threonine protein phosphatase PrpC